MRTNFNFALVILAISFIAGGFVSVAHADEATIGQLNTSLSPYGIGGYVSFNGSYSPPSSDPLLLLVSSAAPEPDSGVVMLETTRPVTQENGDMLSLMPPIPPSDSASGFTPPIFPTVQSTPEPSSFALGGLALTLIAIARISRKNRPISLN